MDELAADAKYEGNVNFLLINCESVDDAKAYAASKGLSGACPHGSGNSGRYFVRYIPHKCLIGKDGLVIKNYDGFTWGDIDDALAADGGGGGGGGGHSRKCRNGCGRPPFRHFPTCCTRCEDADGPHAHDCDERNGVEAKCVNGCGRKRFRHFPTCCKYCKGRDGPHADSCNDRD